MNFFLSVLLGVLSVIVYCMGLAVEGVAMAAFVPLMPRVMGRRLINRTIDLGDGTWGPGGETLHYPVYDRLRMDSTLSGIRTLFKASVGTQREGVTLTYADTNIEKSDSIPSSQKWTFREMQVNYLAHEVRTPAEIQLILNYFRETTVRFIINSKDDMFRIPLWKMMGASQIVTDTPATEYQLFPQGTFFGSWEIKIPIILQSLTTWELRVEPQVASAEALNGDYITFEFDGRRDRKD